MIEEKAEEMTREKGGKKSKYQITPY